MDKLYQQIRISEIREETNGFKTIVFDEGHNINYRAGQYLTLVKNIAGEETRRSYSIISSPLLNEPLAIGVKRVENGLFSRELIDHAKPGDVLTTTGAGGFFSLPEEINRYRQVFFFAAGAGITPVLSLLKTVLYGAPHLSAVLVYSNSAPSKSVYLPLLQELEQQFQNRFQLELLFSNTADLSRARLYRELLIRMVEERSLAAPEATLFFVCGPESYMRMCTYVLQEEGIPKENIRKENFIVASRAVPQTLPPDKDDREVRLTFGHDQYQFIVHYPDSILKAARNNRIALPYSCETGRCGNCVAKCKSGTVWHSYNEVLTEKELASGLILTCVGHPVGGDVELEIG